MNTLIVYATKYGCTEKCAQILQEKLKGKVDLYNLKETKEMDLSQYSKVIVGGSIYIGKIQKHVSNFCVKNLDELKSKKLGLFICNMRDGEFAQEALNHSFPLDLLAHAAAKESFGGEYVFKKMNLLDKVIVKKVAKTDTDVSNILIENINHFAQLMNNA
jgi:menaquinone-dependent protoporphyrinogen oxidase